MPTEPKPKTPRAPRVKAGEIKVPKAPREKVYTIHEAWLLKKLRHLSIDYPVKEECLNAARVGPGKYECAACKKIFKERYYLKADHVDPVVCPVTGFVGIPTYVARLFNEDLSAWQALCAPCHQTKTNEENAIRRAASKARLAAPTE